MFSDLQHLNMKETDPEFAFALDNFKKFCCYVYAY